MMRLLKRGLMFGNLFEVSSPSLVARYNRALQKLTGKSTALQEFHIDISGFSPEIGDELDDPLYLNPEGCNRQFILLSTKQKTAPLLNAHFSTSRAILRAFIDENEKTLFSLTTKDAVAGEMVNSVFKITKPADLLRIRQIEIEADTTGAHIEIGGELAQKIDRFRGEEDAWWDDVLIAEMIELAKHTGDITRYPFKLKKQRFHQGNFYTTHFGGNYIFCDIDKPVCITFGPRNALADMPVQQVLTTRQRAKIAAFLIVNNLAEPIISRRDINTSALLRQKLDFIVAGVAAQAGKEIKQTGRRDIRRLSREYFDQLPDEYHALHELWLWSTDSGAQPKIDFNHPAYFYTLRAAQHDDKALINMLLAQLSPLDFRQLFICHKQAFYEAYRGWSDEKKTYVADFLAAEYLVDKAGARHSLFGPEPDMSEDDIDMPADRTIAGPWG